MDLNQFGRRWLAGWRNPLAWVALALMLTGGLLGLLSNYV